LSVKVCAGLQAGVWNFRVDFDIPDSISEAHVLLLACLNSISIRIANNRIHYSMHIIVVYSVFDDCIGFS
jgi:hypothetical protein